LSVKSHYYIAAQLTVIAKTPSRVSPSNNIQHRKTILILINTHGRMDGWMDGSSLYTVLRKTTATFVFLHNS